MDTMDVVIQDGNSADVEFEPLAPCHPDDPEQPAPFGFITENEYISPILHMSKEQKRAKRMVCECQFDPESDDPREACGEDCLNRVLMIECGSRCPCGEYCNNKRFQRADYARVKVIKTEKKGWGLKACQNTAAGRFVMEYCGEVCTLADFERRKLEYVREKRRHYYFMSLRTDEILDATRKGNNSRFINHSCDPNCETQKWTVGGRLRIGFFAVRTIHQGEELTFDYKFERFGDQAQKCYCGSANCRGYIGQSKQNPNSSTRLLSHVSIVEQLGSPRGSQERRRVRHRLLSSADTAFEKEVYSMVGSSWRLKTSVQVLSLSRIMLQAETTSQRGMLLQVLLATKDSACLKKFLSLQGLRLLWSWMIDSRDHDTEDIITFRVQMLRVLDHLPLTTRNQLEENKLLPIIRKWRERPIRQHHSKSPTKTKERPAVTSDPPASQPEEDYEGTIVTEADSGLSDVAVAEKTFSQAKDQFLPARAEESSCEAEAKYLTSDHSQDEESVDHSLSDHEVLSPLGHDTRLTQDSTFVDTSLTQDTRLTQDSTFVDTSLTQDSTFVDTSLTQDTRLTQDSTFVDTSLTQNLSSAESTESDDECNSEVASVFDSFTAPQQDDPNSDDLSNTYNGNQESLLEDPAKTTSHKLEDPSNNDDTIASESVVDPQTSPVRAKLDSEHLPKEDDLQYYNSTNHSSDKISSQADTITESEIQPDSWSREQNPTGSPDNNYQNSTEICLDSCVGEATKLEAQLEDQNRSDNLERDVASEDRTLEEREALASLAEQLLEKWDGLKEVFRIPKRAPKMAVKAEQEVSSNEGGATDGSEDLPPPPYKRSRTRRRSPSPKSWSRHYREPRETRSHSHRSSYSRHHRRHMSPPPHHVATTPTGPSLYSSNTEFPSGGSVQNTVVVQHPGHGLYVQQQVFKDSCQTTILPASYDTSQQLLQLHQTPGLLVTPTEGQTTPASKLPQPQQLYSSVPQGIHVQPTLHNPSLHNPSLHNPSLHNPSLLPQQTGPLQTGYQSAGLPQANVYNPNTLLTAPDNRAPPNTLQQAQLYTPSPSVAGQSKLFYGPPSTCLPVQSAASALALAPLPPPPPDNDQGLPHNWKSAQDHTGKVYYYHVITRKTQWEKPSEEDTEGTITMDLGTPEHSESEDTTHHDTESPLHNKSQSPSRSPHTPPDESPPDHTSDSEHDVHSLMGPSTPPQLSISSPHPSKSRKRRKHKEKLHKEEFRRKLTKLVTHCLDQHRKPDCKYGKITCVEDFKHLARKLSYGLTEKEISRKGGYDNVDLSDSVKAKVKEYIRQYMKKFGPVYSRHFGRKSPEMD